MDTFGKIGWRVEVERSGGWGGRWGCGNGLVWKIRKNMIDIVRIAKCVKCVLFS